MKSIRELKQDKVILFNQAKAIKDVSVAEGRSMTQEETNSWNTVMDKWTALKADIDQRERLESMETEINASETRSANRPDPGADPEGETRGRVDMASIPIRYQAALRELQKRGDFRMKPEYAASMEGFFRHGQSPRVEARDLQANDNVKGGYIAPPPQFIVGLLKAIDNDLYFRQPGWATVIPLNSAEGFQASLDADPEDGDWTTEIAEVDNDTAMQFGQRELKPNPLTKAIKISNQLIRLTPSVEDLAQERMRYKFGVTMEKAYMTGSGAKQPLGVFIASDDGIPTSRDVSTGNSSTAITSAGLNNAKYSLKAGYRRNAKWLFHRDGLKQIAGLEDDQGYPLWSESLKQGEPDSVKGIPVFESEYAPNTFTTGLYVGILGDFSYYHIADSLTMYIQRVVELYSRTRQTGFHAELWTDGMPVLGEAFARVKLA